MADGKSKDRLFYSKNCSMTIQLERIQPEFDGLDQLAKAFSRILSNWDDVWGSYTIRTSDSRVRNDWAAEEAAAQATATKRHSLN